MSEGASAIVPVGRQLATVGAPEIDWQRLLQGPTPTPLALAKLPEQVGKINACLAAAKQVRLLVEAGTSQKLALTLTVPNGISRSTWERDYLAYKRTGRWGVFVDEREIPELWKGGQRGPDRGIVDAFSRLVLDVHRPMGGVTAHLELKKRLGKLPRGCSYANLMRHGPAADERAAAQQGASAARAYRAPARFTRANGWSMGRVSIDDVWKDQFCLLPRFGKPPEIVRPVGGYAGDFYSGTLFAHFLRPRTRRPDGTTENLTEWDFVCFIEYICRCIGVSPKGTTFVVENATATIRRRVELALQHATDGAVSVERAGRFTKRATMAQWGAKGGGNPRAKGWLESLWNLLHNRCGLLPGQMGLSPDQAPEDLGKLLRYTEGLIESAIREQGGQAEGKVMDALRMPLLWWGEYCQRVTDIVGEINGRTEHALEGWDAHCIVDPQNGIMRRRRPSEVLAMGLGDLQRIDDAGSALILGTEHAKIRKVINRELAVPVRSLTGDDLLFDAGLIGLGNDDRVKCVINELAPDRLFVFSLEDEFIAAAPRIVRADPFQAGSRRAETRRADAREIAQFANMRRLKEPAAQARAELVSHNTGVLAEARAERGLPPLPAPGGEGRPRRKKILALSGSGPAGASTTTPESNTGGAATPPVCPPKRFRLGGF